MLISSMLCRSSGCLPVFGRVVVAVLAFLPLLIVALCMVPALVLWPFVPVTRNEIPKRIDQLIKWTQLILQSITPFEKGEGNPSVPINDVVLRKASR
jgi:hypothetical protein